MTSFTSNTAKPIHTSKPSKVALVQASWHSEIIAEFRTSFVNKINKTESTTVDLFEVPGAFEIPLLVKQLAASGEYAGIAAVGLVVDGGIYRHEFVATAVINGLMQVQLETGVPVFSGVLTPHDFISEGREEFFRRHFVIKGEEVASACLAVLKSQPQLESKHSKATSLDRLAK